MTKTTDRASARTHACAVRLLRDGHDPTTIADALFLEALALWGAAYGPVAQLAAQQLLAAIVAHQGSANGD